MIYQKKKQVSNVHIMDFFIWFFKLKAQHGAEKN